MGFYATNPYDARTTHCAGCEQEIYSEYDEPIVDFDDEGHRIECWPSELCDECSAAERAVDRSEILAEEMSELEKLVLRMLAQPKRLADYLPLLAEQLDKDLINKDGLTEVARLVLQEINGGAA